MMNLKVTGPPRTYEPPTVLSGSVLDLANEPLLAPGVRGFAIEHEGRVFIGGVFAINQGQGDVGRFIDSLGPRCVFAHVVSDRLAGMLFRRGFKRHMERVQGTITDVWERP